MEGIVPQESSAAAMIRRFREGKPTSREDRLKARQEGGAAGGTANKMWWQDENLDHEPRSLDVKPASQAPKPHPALRNQREPEDYMAGGHGRAGGTGFYQDRKLGETIGVDDLIEDEIRLLEREVLENDRKTSARLDLGSYDPTRSVDLNMRKSNERAASPHYRFTGATGTAGAGVRVGAMAGGGFDPRLSDSGDLLRKYNIGNYSPAPPARAGGGMMGSGSYNNRFPPITGGAATSRGGGGGISPLRLSRTRLSADSDAAADLLRSSVETLGSTGFKGLLKSNLKLDGKKDDEEEKDKRNAADLQKNLEEMLKAIQANHPPRNPYFPDGCEETISQITNKVQSDIIEFQTLFGDKFLQEDDSAKAQKDRDEEMKEAGRNEYRQQQLLALDLPASHPLEFLGMWDGQQQYPVMGHQNNPPLLSYLPHSATAAVGATGTPTAAVAGAAAAVAAGGDEAGNISQQQQQGQQDEDLRASDNSSLDMNSSPFPNYKSTVQSPNASTEGTAANKDDSNTRSNNNSGGGSGGAPPTSSATASATASTAAAAGPTGVSAAGGVRGGEVLGPMNASVQLPFTRPPTGEAAAAARRVAAAAAGAGVGAGVPAGLGFAPGVGLVQTAVDVEMAAADEVLGKMRALRTQLGSRMRHLDALHGSITPTPASYHYPPAHAPPGSAGGVIAAGTAAAAAAANRGNNNPFPGLLPLYARPSGPPPPPAAGAGGSGVSGAASASYPAGLGPMFNASHANPVNRYWGLEQYYDQAEAARLAATEDTRVLFNPYPELVHDNIFGVSRGVTSALNVAMDTLHNRLPVVVPAAEETPAPLDGGDRGPSPYAQDSTAERVKQQQQQQQQLEQQQEQEKDEKQKQQPEKPSEAPATPSTVAIDVVNAAIHTAVEQAASHATAGGVGGGNAASSASSDNASSSSSGSNKGVEENTKNGTLPSMETVRELVTPALKHAMATAPLIPSASVRTELQSLDAVLGVDDNKSNFLARDQFVPTQTSSNTFPSAAPHYLKAADAFLRDNYPPSMFDPRRHYQNHHQNKYSQQQQQQQQYQQQQGKSGAGGGAVVIQAPSDQELRERQQAFNNYHSHQAQSQQQQPRVRFEFQGASAPPATLNENPRTGLTPSLPPPSSAPVTPAPPQPAAGVLPPVYQPAYPVSSAADVATHLIQQASHAPLRRPMEGSALNHIRNTSKNQGVDRDIVNKGNQTTPIGGINSPSSVAANVSPARATGPLATFYDSHRNIGVTQTPAGAKYVSPFDTASSGSSSNSSSSNNNNNNNNNYYNNNSNGRLNNSSTAGRFMPASALAGTATSTSEAPAPMHDRENYLQKMQKLRTSMLSV